MLCRNSRKHLIEMLDSLKMRGSRFQEMNDTGRLIGKSQEWIRKLETGIEALDIAIARMNPRDEQACPPSASPPLDVRSAASSDSG
jgi:hypothetical protein